MKLRIWFATAFSMAAIFSGTARATFAVDSPLTTDVVSLAAAIEAEEPQLLLLDASTLDRYELGHIPGAVHVWWQDTMNWNDTVYGTILPPSNDEQERVAWLKSIGATPDGRVVVYDNESGLRAARIVWFLRFLGYDNVSLLRGGIDDWLANGGAIDRSRNSGESDGTPIVAPRKGWYVSTAEVLRRIDAADTQIVDTRSAEEAGDNIDGSLPLGRIPTAVSLPWTDLIDPATNQLLSIEEISAIALSAGLAPDLPVILYATYGVDPALVWIALSSAGFTNVAIYDGGWAEWASNPERPTVPLSDVS